MTDVMTPTPGEKSAEATEDKEMPMPTHSLHTLVFRSLKRTADMFSSDHYDMPPDDLIGDKLYRDVKAQTDYGESIVAATAREKRHGDVHKKKMALPEAHVDATVDPETGAVTMHTAKQTILRLTAGETQHALPEHRNDKAIVAAATKNTADGIYDNVKSMLPSRAPTMRKPTWHAPWKLYRVISGHTGWVRCVDVEPGNQWFATGGADRIIKIWDLATGQLKLSLTGHIHTVRGIKISHRQPYLFSVGEDKTVKCWDLEYNKVIRHYHGHMSAVYDCALHPTIDVLATSGRDSSVRVWDMRTMAQVHCFSGHTNTVGTIAAQASAPEIISGSHDSTVRLWDLAAGKSRATLTHHKKSIRSVVIHPKLYMFGSASPDNIKQWVCPDGKFVQNLSGHNAIVNSLACNQDGVLVSGGDNGSIHFWDWMSGTCFQKEQTKPQPGSIDCEAGIYAMTFDQSHSRLITCEADKTIKMYKEDEEATEESHPIVWRHDILKRKQY